MKTLWKALMLSGSLLLTPLASQASLIDFEADGLGGVANGFTSSADSAVHFSDTVGAGLSLVSGIPECAFTTCLAAFDDFDGSGIQVDFDMAVMALSFDYGNDQIFGGNPAATLLVQFFLNNVAVGSASAAPNFNDLMDQTFSYVGSAFDRAIITYVAGNGSTATLIETIDNLQYVVAVPAPQALSLFGLGLLLLRRRLQR